MSTFHVKLTSQSKKVGQESVGTSSLLLVADRKLVSGPYALPSPKGDFLVSSVWLHIWDTGGSGPCKAIIYGDDGSGEPKKLLGVSDEATITNVAGEWNEFPFATPVLVPTGSTIHIGTHSNSGSLNVTHGVAPSGIKRTISVDEYDDGPADPFGSPTQTDDELSAYVVGTFVFPFLLAEGDEGEPRVRLGSREKEAAKAGERGTIVIQSLHHGSGQHVSRDPMMYEFADGMFADKPGLLEARGEVSLIGTVGTNLGFRHKRRGGLYASRLHTEKDVAVIVVPTAIYTLDTNGVVTSRLSAAGSAQWTGSSAKFGANRFFGATVSGGILDTWAGRWDQAAFGSTWADNAGFKALLLTAQGDKLWRAQGTPGTVGVDLSWSDDAGNATPVFANAFNAFTGRPQPRDLAILGPHAIIAIDHETSGDGSVIAVDTSGMFTPILSEQPVLAGFIPYLGGQLVIPKGGSEVLWLRSVTAFSIIRLSPLPSVRGRMAFLNYWSSTDIGEVGLGASRGADIFLHQYGDFTKRDGTVVSGSIILHGRLVDNDLVFHTLLTPESSSFLVDAHIMAMRVSENTPISTPTAAPPMALQMLVATPNSGNSANSDVKVYQLEMGRGSGDPASFDTGTKFLRTSRYSTPSRTTAQMEVMRGYITKIPDDNTVVVRVYLDGSATETYNFSLNSAGPFSQALPTNVIGRDIAIDFETNANGSVIIEFPWSIDYFAVPDQKDIVRLPILAGRDQLTRAGTLQKGTRAEILDTLADLVASPEKWTLKWWDATPDWDVIPIDYQAADTEPDFVPGAGAAVAWLTLQRL